MSPSYKYTPTPLSITANQSKSTVTFEEFLRESLSEQYLADLLLLIVKRYERIKGISFYRAVTMSDDLQNSGETKDRRNLFDEKRRAPARHDPELMGPILRRKKVVSMPLGTGGEF